jgi:glycine cleavage system H lipoate-binding protein
MIMKTNKLIVTLSAVAVAAFVAGCGDSKPKTDEKAVETSTPASSPAATLPEAANQAVESAKASGTIVVQETKTVLSNATAQIEQTTTTLTVEAKKAAEDAVAPVTNAVAEATKQVETTTAAATTQVQALIDKATALVTDKKYMEALTSLQQLSGFQLTADQQKTVDSLKATIQTAMNSEAGKAVQGLFK